MTGGPSLQDSLIGRLSLGRSDQGTEVAGHGFAGQGGGRVLVIAGVHGSERSGVEVAERLVAHLEAGFRPVPETLIVRALFPDNVAAALREGAVPTNRNFPAPGESLATASRRGNGTPVDSLGVALLPENRILLELLDRFRPGMIISVHATMYPERAGIFADPHRVPANAASALSETLVTAATADTARDAALALRLARVAAARGVSVAGNRLDGDPTSLWSGESPEGTSLGGWGPCAVVEGGPGDRPAIGIITVEIDGLANSAEAKDPSARRAELSALAETLRDEALGRDPLQQGH